MSLPAAATWNIASGATLDLNAGGTEAANIIINGPGAATNFGALRLDNCTVAGNVLLAGPGNNNQIGATKNNTTSTISGVISDGGMGFGINRVGFPPAVANVIALSGQNNYSGATTLSSNILRVSSVENPGVSGPLGKSAASNPGSIIFAGGILQYSSANQNDYSGRFSTAANQPYDIDVNGQSVSFATPLTSSSGSLTLSDATGAGTLTLNATNIYSGGTTVNAGTLVISTNSSIAGNVVVNAGTLKLDNAASMSAGAALSVILGTTADLNYAGTQNISALFVDSVQQASGVYGASTNNPDGIFTGSGTLTVTGGPSVTISTPTIADDQLSICWTSVSSVNYNVYTTTNLAPPIIWTLVNSSPIPATGTTTCYTLPGSVLGQSQLFVTVKQ
jgi:autotransporter-associated beta strand protein